MSTETDIVIKALRQQRGGATLFDETNGRRLGMAYELAVDLITKLRAERAAAARDMRERAAAIAEYEHHVCAQQSDQAKAAGLRSDMYRFNTALHTAAKIAERVRALPDTPAVIATSGKDAT